MRHLALVFLSFLAGLWWLNSMEAAGEERAKQPILSVTPIATPAIRPEKGVYGAGDSNVVALGGETDDRLLGSLSGASVLWPQPVFPRACFVYALDRPLACVDAPAGWAAQALAIGECESHWRTEAVGEAGELGILQIHPIHFPRMVLMGLDLQFEPDRLKYAFWLWESSGRSFRQWSCAQRVGVR